MPLSCLDDRAILAVSGADARPFLHNLLTVDMDDVDRDGAGYGGLLSPQGKILADFLIHKAEDCYLLDVRSETVEDLLKRLTLYRLRSKVELRPEPDLAVFAAWAEDGGGRPADPRFAPLGARWVAAREGEAPHEDLAAWHAWRIEHAVPEGGIDFVFGDSFPHDAAMDDLGGVDFDKGCFVGQEVVSRMRHRGTARRRIVAIRARGALPGPGAEIVAGERPVGRLGSSHETRGIALVRLDRVREALDAKMPLRAGPEEVDIVLPVWASYGWPAAPSSEGD
ncbi:MAG TPA: folate-binding protein [Afifellaceae bacterium]|nr:folate-binding protein [Afifellaceae bacterium]